MKKKKAKPLKCSWSKGFFVSFIKIFLHCDHQNFKLQWKTSKMGSHLKKKKKTNKKTNKAYGKHKNEKRTSPKKSIVCFSSWVCFSSVGSQLCSGSNISTAGCETHRCLARMTAVLTKLTPCLWSSHEIPFSCYTTADICSKALLFGTVSTWWQD